MACSKAGLNKQIHPHPFILSGHTSSSPSPIQPRHNRNRRVHCVLKAPCCCCYISAQFSTNPEHLPTLRSILQKHEAGILMLKKQLDLKKKKKKACVSLQNNDDVTWAKLEAGTISPCLLFTVMLIYYFMVKATETSGCLGEKCEILLHVIKSRARLRACFLAWCDSV